MSEMERLQFEFHRNTERDTGGKQGLLRDAGRQLSEQNDSKHRSEGILRSCLDIVFTT